MSRLRFILSCFIISALLILQPTAAQAYGNAENITIDASSISRGMIEVRASENYSKRLKLLIQKGSSKYTYDLRADNLYEVFPLQLGNGEYSVKVLENTSGDRYKVISSKKVRLSLDKPDSVYLNAVQGIRWDLAGKSSALADKLAEDSESSDETIKAIYEYITNNMTYDREKVKNLKTGYLPNPDSTLESSRGMCYDFASLFASMLRSQGIPAKLVKGSCDIAAEYHAWNEVYMESLSRWVVIDISSDVCFREAGVKYTMIKDSDDYNSRYVY